MDQLIVGYTMKNLSMGPTPLEARGQKIRTILEGARWCEVQNVHLHDREALSEVKHIVLNSRFFPPLSGHKFCQPVVCLLSKDYVFNFVQDKMQEKCIPGCDTDLRDPKQFLHRCLPDMLPFPVPNVITVIVDHMGHCHLTMRLRIMI